MTEVENYGVIEQEHSHIDFGENGNINFVIEEKPKEDELLIAENSKINQNKQRCQFIKKNGKRCRQVGKPSQSGGPIINGYCSYHRKRK